METWTIATTLVLAYLALTIVLGVGGIHGEIERYVYADRS